MQKVITKLTGSGDVMCTLRLFVLDTSISDEDTSIPDVVVEDDIMLEARRHACVNIRVVLRNYFCSRQNYVMHTRLLIAHRL